MNQRVHVARVVEVVFLLLDRRGVRSEREALLQEFEGAPAEQVRADVEEFLARLRELGIVE